MADIVSPLPGVFYRRPAPDKEPFVNPGDTVAEGDPIGIVEIMKQFTEVTADTAGVVGEFQVEDATQVNPGDVLVTVTEG